MLIAFCERGATGYHLSAGLADHRIDLRKAMLESLPFGKIFHLIQRIHAQAEDQRHRVFGDQRIITPFI